MSGSPVTELDEDFKIFSSGFAGEFDGKIGYGRCGNPKGAGGGDLKNVLYYVI